MTHTTTGPTALERVRSHLQPSDGGCLLWTGYAADFHGGIYGRTRIDGRLRFVHRVVLEAAQGPIPRGVKVGRTCRRTLCCNPDHMFLFSRAEDPRR